jgi:hypothetical protein
VLASARRPMTILPALILAGMAALVLALVAAPRPERAESVRAAALAVAPRPGLGPTAVAQTRQLRAVAAGLADELAGAAGCDPHRAQAAYAACVLPGLRRVGIGGRTAALFLRQTMVGLPAGACRNQLAVLTMAAGLAGQQAGELLAALYWPRPSAHRAQTAHDLAGAAQMLRDAYGRAEPASCALPARGPAL